MTGWLRNTLFGADKTADAQREATDQAVGAQEKALEYLMQREQIPGQIRDEALTDLAGFYQVPGQMKSQEDLIAEAKASPLYGAIMGNLDLGIDEILRTSSATGQLRSGAPKRAIADTTTQLANQALLQSFGQAQARDDYSRAMNLQGIQGLAGLGTNQNAIAGTIQGIGTTQAQGTIGQAQTQAGAQNNLINTLLGVGQLAASFSDIRLKTNIRYLGDNAGFSWYRWTWNEKAAELGLEGDQVGVLAHQVFDEYPDAISVERGYLKVDYDRLEAA